MKYSIPEISWHNKDPVLSVDFQPKSKPIEISRLATGGTDSHVLIWYISTSEAGAVHLEVAADLTHHQKAVNVVRWSPNGEYLASGDDESIIFIWKKSDKEPPPAAEGDEPNKESWVIHKTLRGHMEDILDITWSANSKQLASGSVDNKLLIWDLAKGRYSSILTDHKGFVQGVSWDPQGQFIATASSDRVFRTFDITTKKVLSRSSKAILPLPKEHPLHNVKVRLYHDDTLQTFYRRLDFSPDGLLIAVPAGRLEPEQSKVDTKPINAVYIYTRYSLKVPACILPCGEAPALACRWSPCRYSLRKGGPSASFPLPHRSVLAVATKRCLIIYDTQQKTPLALISNIHYTRLTDLTWSSDGRILVASSTDGFCSVMMFSEGELGEVVSVQETTFNKSVSELMDTSVSEDVPKQETPKPKEKVSKINSFMKFKAPSERSPKKPITTQANIKTPVKRDLMEEVAMPSWSDNSSNDIIKPKEEPVVITIDDSQDMKLVYEDTEGLNKSADAKSPPIAMDVDKKPTDDNESTEVAVSPFLKQAKVMDVKEAVTVNTLPSPKAPRRVSFVTLSSPKNPKKKC